VRYARTYAKNLARYNFEKKS